jgi:hypothetical protein
VQAVHPFQGRAAMASRSGQNFFLHRTLYVLPQQAGWRKKKGGHKWKH